MQKIVCVPALLVALLVASSGGFAADTQKAVDRQATIDMFYSRPLKEQLTAFPSYAFDDQYAIYIYGNQVRHPPAIYLARPFGAEGRKVVQPLSLALNQASDDGTIRDLVLVFSEMNSQMAYDVASDQQLMQILTEAVARMKNQGWKNISTKELQSIRAARASSQ
jgi:hypothetical protein